MIKSFYYVTLYYERERTLINVLEQNVRAIDIDTEEMQRKW